jgi:hypothetical protein
MEIRNKGQKDDDFPVHSATKFIGIDGAGA